tara:strand:- start:65 stop:742 length:678 start_codon:yes stop_codon:yes gene_type:complete
MSKAVTIIRKESPGYVRIGLLEETGRIYYHIRMIDGALSGMMEPASAITEVPRASVELIDGWRFDLLSAQLANAQAILQWQAERQQAVAAIKAEAEAKLEKQVEVAIKRWEREHPRPGHSLTSSTDPDEAEPPESPQRDEPLAPEGTSDLVDHHAPATPQESSPVATGAWSPAVGETVMVKEAFEVGTVEAIQFPSGGYFVQILGSNEQTLFNLDDLEPVALTDG